MQVRSGSNNRTLTSIGDVQTCAVADLDIVGAVIAFAEGEAIQITRDMVGRSCVCVPVGIDLVPGAGSGDVHRVLLFIAMERAIKTLAALNSDVPLYATELACGAMVLASITVTAVASTAAAAVSTIAAMTATDSLIPSGLSALVAATLLLVGVTGAGVGEAGRRV